MTGPRFSGVYNHGMIVSIGLCGTPSKWPKLLVNGALVTTYLTGVMIPSRRVKDLGWCFFFLGVGATGGCLF